jgi:hypothetical protein
LGRKRFSSGWLGIALAMLLVGVMAGFFIARSQSSGDQAALDDANARVAELQSALSHSEDRNWTYYQNYQTLKAQLEQGGSSASSTTPSHAPQPGTYTEGVYLVGEDIPAGTFDGAVNGGLGYWARLKDTDGANSSIVENAIVKGPFVLTVQPSDRAVELRGVTLTKR